MKKKTLMVLCAILTAFTIFSALLAPTVFAQAPIIGDIDQRAGDFGRGLGLPDNSDPVVLIGNIITFILGFLGVVFLVLVIYSGFMYMISQGDTEKTKSALHIIRGAVGGIIIIVLALALVRFVLVILGKA